MTSTTGDPDAGTAPVLLAPNQPPSRGYRGGAGIVALRGAGSGAIEAPEDFVASVTTVHGDDAVGLTRLPDGRLLRDAIAADPETWLGSTHVARFGAHPELLVKLLDTGERLFVHLHPTNAFAAKHLDEPRGKTEAWLIVATAEPTATVWAGLRDGVDADAWRDWVARQDVDAMLDALHRFEVRAGDWVHVPAGAPHAIGAGVTVVELQQPTDISLLLETPDGAVEPLLGLPLDTVLAELAPDGVVPVVEHGSPGDGVRARLLPESADPFYRAELLRVTDALDLDPDYSVLVMLDGTGELRWATGVTAVRGGDVVLVPFGADVVTIAGDLRVLRCMPPAA